MWTAPGAAPRCDGSRGSSDPTAPISISAPARSISRRRSPASGFRGTVLGADFVLPMLARGKGKAPRTRPVGADALALPFVDARFDGAMVAFGVRNLADLDA